MHHIAPVLASTAGGLVDADDARVIVLYQTAFARWAEDAGLAAAPRETVVREAERGRELHRRWLRERPAPREEDRR